MWVVERRENLLEDHSRLGAAPAAMFDYYLGWIGKSDPGTHFKRRPTRRFARDWGMRVAVEDLRVVVRAAARGGRRVVLGGHSLGRRSRSRTRPGTSAGARARGISPGWC